MSYEILDEEGYSMCYLRGGREREREEKQSDYMVNKANFHVSSDYIYFWHAEIRLVKRKAIHEMRMRLCL